LSTAAAESNQVVSEVGVFQTDSPQVGLPHQRSKVALQYATRKVHSAHQSNGKISFFIKRKELGHHGMPRPAAPVTCAPKQVKQHP